MAEPNAWETWTLPALDSDNNSENQDTIEPVDQSDNDIELGDEESIETVDDWQAEEAESVEEVAATEIQLPSAEELEQLRKTIELEAYAEGFAKGESHGKESGHKQALDEAKSYIEQQLSQLHSIAQAMIEPIAQQDEAIEAVMLNSIVTLTKAVIQRELSATPDAITELVQQAMAALPGKDQSTQVFINPSDLKFIESHAADQSHWQLMADEQITPGGCKISTADSTVDMSVESRVESAIEQFLGKTLTAPTTNSDATEESPKPDANAPHD